ncbi:hypothetical protein BDV33DRAFT_197963 [Aspergillus novoparasiticus]|uniref:Uncharacterized protein n=1 Tax=Aspergillus novoparasiticus TaxID=986946 RepID=A0A5N6FB93_9EURO|nr:hypothetical protein BDV33DRAFT_197963 [Aspergillus novoparasiticus]
MAASSSRAVSTHLLTPGTPEWIRALENGAQSCMASRLNNGPYEVWEQGDGEGKDLRILGRGQVDRGTIASWKVVLSLHDPKVYGWPPRNTRLSDAWVVLAILYCGTRERATRWQADFELNGNIRKTRIPIGLPVTALVNGQYWTLVYKGYYALIGGESAKTTSWLVNTYPGSGSSSRLQVGVILAEKEKAIGYANLPLLYGKAPVVDFTQFPTYILFMPGLRSIAETGTHQGKDLRLVKDRQLAIQEGVSQTQPPSTEEVVGTIDLTTATPLVNPLTDHPLDTTKQATTPPNPVDQLDTNEQSRTPSPIMKLKELHERLWKETKEAFNSFKGRKDAETVLLRQRLKEVNAKLLSNRDEKIAKLRQQLESANTELLVRQQKIDSLEEYLTEQGLF